MRLKNPEVRIENTSKCNAHCTICPREKMTRAKVTMPLEHFKLLVDQANGMGATTVTVFGYGEPLVDKGIVDKIKYCSDMGLNTFITTNAFCLSTQVACDLIRAGLKHIRFSCNGLFGTYEKVHTPLRFGTVLRNIANFIRINRVKYDNPVRVDVSITPMHGETVETFLDFWGRFNLDGIEIWRPHNWAGGRFYRQVVRKKKTCGRPFNGPVQINADGKMMVCCFDTDATMTVGDTYESTVEEILRGEAFERIRNSHDSGNLSGLICENCDQLNEYEESPLLYSTVDPSCEFGKTSSCKIKLEES